MCGGIASVFGRRCGITALGGSDLRCHNVRQQPPRRSPRKCRSANENLLSNNLVGDMTSRVTGVCYARLDEESSPLHFLLRALGNRAMSERREPCETSRRWMAPACGARDEGRKNGLRDGERRTGSTGHDDQHRWASLRPRLLGGHNAVRLASPIGPPNARGRCDRGADGGS